MKTPIFFLFLVVLILSASPSIFANSPPVVSNVSASQRNDDSKLVDIYYSLADADGDTCTIWVVISKNNGQTWDVPAITFTGQCGNGITPGNGKHIIWDAGRDVPGQSGSTFKARVFASDGKGDPMVLVPAGSYREDGGSNWVFVSSYMIGKYEVTNAQYAEFLNDADPYSQNWDIAMEIARSGSSGSYSYTPIEGKEQYPIRYVSYYDAEAYCQWKSQTTGLNYHLPDKYQWQKAAAWDPVQQKFWLYGFQHDTIGCGWCNYGNCQPGPIQVGFYNGLNSYYGCYDMSGNVYEWTTEQIYYGRAPRGGSWNYGDVDCRVDIPYRWDDILMSSRTYILGFRVVMDSQ
jgi:formylglycine-generating enzyme required for sulfatase activity